MALGAGTRLGPYEIGSLLGAGGMGEVYKVLENITNPRRINTVYLRGQQVDRPALRARWQARWTSGR